ncbi:MAG: quinolinate synthase NadA [Bilophila wadsworthia]
MRNSAQTRRQADHRRPPLRAGSHHPALRHPRRSSNWRRVPGIASDYIVFCGVYFMAESAALLAREGQRVLLPDHSADCVMAQMTPAWLLDRVLGRLTASGSKLVLLVTSTLRWRSRPWWALRRRGVHADNAEK